MKGIFLQLCLLFSFVSSFSQSGATGNLYEDAVKFYNGITNSSKVEDALGVVAFYFNSPDVSQLNVGATIAGNPFLASFSGKLGVVAAPPGGAKNASPTAGAAAGVLGMNVAKYADGLAKFLIERGKQELSMAFFDRFRKDLDAYPEIRFIFPKSAKIIKEIEDHNINTVLQELRDAFIKDLTSMPDNILSLRELAIADCPTGDADCNTRVTALAAAIKNGAGTGIDQRFFIIPLNAVQGIINGNNIIEIMSRIVNDKDICTVNDDFNSILKVTTILLEAFRTNDINEGIFISQNKLNNLFSSADLLKIFLGLTYQKFNSSTCYKDLKVSDKSLEDIFNKVIDARVRFNALLTSFDKINLAYYAVKRQLLNAQKPDLSNFAAISVASISLIKDFTESIHTVLGIPVPPAYQALYTNLNIAADFCADIHQRNYTGIFNDVIRFIQSNNITVNDKAKQKIVKYLGFAANLASASNSDEVKDAINSVALPPGSYSIKQKSAHTIALNAYVGYAWDLNGGDLYARGIYAPLGFSFSAGLSRKHGGALSIFTSIVDVGALVSYRLKDNVTEELKQEIRLESIISPSAQLVIGIPKVPIAVCTGWRLAPKLFYSNSAGFTTVPAKSVFNIGVVIDVPVFTIFNKPYN